jgi:hypothetical protein
MCPQGNSVVFPVATAVTNGSIVSLTPTGVARGYGMQISSSITTFDNMTNPKVPVPRPYLPTQPPVPHRTNRAGPPPIHSPG